MDQARRFNRSPCGETPPVQRAKFGTKFLNPRSQHVGIALVDPFGNQPGQQVLSVVQGSRQFGQPAGAASGPQGGQVIHIFSLSGRRLPGRIDKLHFGGNLG